MSRLTPHKQLDTPRDTGHYQVAGPKTFRLGCRKFLSNKRETEYNNYGGNRQNIEKKMRRLWIADKGYKLIQVDQSGADALIVAHLCRAGKYRQLFQNDIKPHTYVALRRFADKWKERFDKDCIDKALNTPIPALPKLDFWGALNKLIKSSDDWSANERFYYMGKKVVHAGSYGMRGNRLVAVIREETLGEVILDKVEADKFILWFRGEEFPEIQEWNYRVVREAKTAGIIRNLHGFPFYITERINEQDAKDLIAWGPQSTVAGITRQAYIDMQEYIEDNNRDWHMLQETHDSYLCEAPEEEEVECAKLMQTFMEPELTSPIDGVKFRMRSEVQVGYNWAPKSSYNPQGLEELKIAA